MVGIAVPEVIEGITPIQARSPHLAVSPVTLRRLARAIEGRYPDPAFFPRTAFAMISPITRRPSAWPVAAAPVARRDTFTA